MHKIAVAFVLQPCKCQALVFWKGINPILWSRIGVNLNYEGHWVESSRVLSFHGKNNYVGNVFYRRSLNIHMET